MTAFFDTSCLLAAFINSEPENASCLACLQRYEKDAAIAAHSLAECFHILSGRRNVTPLLASELIRTNIVEKFSVVALSRDDYARTLASAHALGIRGGAIYDALILAAARKSKANRIFTLCAIEFRAFAPDLADRIQRP